MYVRRAFFYAQFGAVVVLPLWLLIGRGIIFSGSGWDFVLLLFVCPILAVYLAVILGLTIARKSVRSTRTVDWSDVGLLTIWYALLIVAGFVAHNGIAVLVVVTSVAAFWIQLWQLISETRHRVNRALTRMDATRSPSTTDGKRDYDVIRIDPKP